MIFSPLTSAHEPPDNRIEYALLLREKISKVSSSSLPNKEEQQIFWEHFDTARHRIRSFQNFLRWKGNGGTGKSAAVSLIQYVVESPHVQHSYRIGTNDFMRLKCTESYKRSVDIPCKAMENTDVLKKAVGEDTPIYEKKDRMQSIFTLMLLFLPMKCRRILRISRMLLSQTTDSDMNRSKKGQKDSHLKEKVQVESDYAIYMAMIALEKSVRTGKSTESKYSKECKRSATDAR